MNEAFLVNEVYTAPVGSLIPLVSHPHTRPPEGSHIPSNSVKREGHPSVATEWVTRLGACVFDLKFSSVSNNMHLVLSLTKVPSIFMY